MFLFSDNIIVYVENPEKIRIKLTELKTEYIILLGY